jgi:biotin operon repressor
MSTYYSVSAHVLKAVEDAIRKRGTLPFAGREIGAEIGYTRQTVYKAIHRLNEMGHRIEGEPKMGFFARMREHETTS